MQRSLPIALLACLASGVAAQTMLTARLDGAQEVPPVQTRAAGWAIVNGNNTTRNVRIFVETSGLTARAAHLHMKAAGSNGPVILPLTGGPTRWTGQGVLSAVQYAALLAGGTYLNVHTATNPGGEIRGQVSVPTTSVFHAALNGAQEVPPVRTAATGTALCYLHEPDNVLTYMVNSSGLQNVVAAHIHLSPTGSNGGVIHPLRGANGTYCGVTGRLTAAQLRALKANGLYFNIHTSTNRRGEIRGQIVQQKPGGFRATLDGGQEVPPVTTRASGLGCATINPDRTVTYVVWTTGLTGRAAHVHNRARGANGPVVFPLTGGPSIWRGTSPRLTTAQLNVGRAGNWYFNVHTAGHPGGEIRGQLTAAAPATTFGAGCPGSANTTAEIGAEGLPCPAGRYTVTIHGATAGVAGAVLFGARPLDPPVDLGPIGMRRCFLLHDDLGISLRLRTDSRGCARVSFSFPPTGALTRVVFYNQAAFLDRGANTLGVAASNALKSQFR